MSTPSRFTHGRFFSYFNAEVASMMHSTFSRIYWPLFAFFIWREKIHGEEGITLAHLRENDFTSNHVKVYIRQLAILKIPLVEFKESTLSRGKYTLTKPGRVVAEMVWKTLNYYMLKLQNITLDQEVEKYKQLLTLEVERGVIDEEEKFLQEMEERARKAEEARKNKAGIVDTPEGPKIDLDKVIVK